MLRLSTACRATRLRPSVSALSIAYPYTTSTRGKMGCIGGFNNTGRGPLLVPGFNQLPVDLKLQEQYRFTSNDGEWALTPNLTVRELAMLTVMNTITDIPGWSSRIFDEHEMKIWEQLLQSTNELMSAKAWKWCLDELRDKAREEKKGVLVFNTATGIYKSEVLSIADNIKRAALSLIISEGSRGCSKSRENDQLLEFVDPSLFPLVYGQSHVLAQGGQIELGDCFRIPTDFNLAESPILACESKQLGLPENRHPGWHLRRTGIKHWSKKFQWLPSEVQFCNRTDTTVQITSYINNLHPDRYPELYAAISGLISSSIEPWNKILLSAKRGRTPRRINTWGVEWEPAWPDWATDEFFMEAEKGRMSKYYEASIEKIKDYLALPENATRAKFQTGVQDDIEDDWDNPKNLISLRQVVMAKWNRLRSWKHPEASHAYTYEQWKSGITGAAIIKQTNQYQAQFIPPYPEPNHEFYEISLQDSFREDGLQIITRMSGIELSPENTLYPGGEWSQEALQNEHIVATAILFFDIDNIDEGSYISFRQQTYFYEGSFEYEEGRPQALAAVFGIPGIEDQIDNVYMGGPPSIQDLGSIAITQGRHLAWPSVLQHKLGPVRLSDTSRRGHLRFIMIHLVDPHYRICSTRNVPPQREDWWQEALASAIGPKAPREIVNEINQKLGIRTMSLKEAEECREELVTERTAAETHKQNRGSRFYNWGTEYRPATSGGKWKHTAEGPPAA